MIKKGFVTLTLFSSLLLLMFFKKNDQKMNQSNDRFTHYKAVDKKEKSISVMYLTWGNTNLPNYVLLEDYKKYADQEKLIQHCFYVDSKNASSLNFTKEIRDKFTKKIPVELKGKFYKTTKFDDTFPSRLFEDYRRTNDLGFKTPNDEFLVFVID